jgi:hypothetical protein
MEVFFAAKDDVSETEKEDTVAKLPRQISSGGTARTTTLKYFNVNFKKGKNYVDRVRVYFYGHYVYLHSFVFNNFTSVQKCPVAVKMYPNHGADFYTMHHQR